MKKYIVTCLLLTSILVGCQNDEVMNPFSRFEIESFADISPDQFQQLETPYESYFQNGRLAAVKDEDDAVAVIKSIFNNILIIEVEEITERGILAWEIEFKTADGAKIELVIAQDSFRIIEMEGQSGPFNYQIEPEGSFITLKQALETALAEINGELIRWELELEEDDEWEYELHIRQNGKILEVEIDAFQNTVLAIKQIEDDDLDDYEEYFEKPGEDVPSEVLDQVNALIQGNIINTEFDDDAYEIYVQTESGAVVEFYFDESGQMEEIEGENGPFDYDFGAITGLISFAKAKQIALQLTDHAGEIEEWSLDLRDDPPYYEFELEGDGKEWEIELNAQNGDVLDIDYPDSEDDQHDDDNDDDDQDEDDNDQDDD
ncbi:MAG: PepSY domain-containing protein [Candidatus Cyclobacteriaceae bacterium M3_2C_046]